MNTYLYEYINRSNFEINISKSLKLKPCRMTLITLLENPYFVPS